MRKFGSARLISYAQHLIGREFRILVRGRSSPPADDSITIQFGIISASAKYAKQSGQYLFRRRIEIDTCSFRPKFDRNIGLVQVKAEPAVSRARLRGRCLQLIVRELNCG